MSTPTLDRFLGEVARIVQEKNSDQLQQYLVIEPPFPPLYSQMITELRQTYPEFNQNPLEDKCKSYITEYDDSEEGGSRIPFLSFLNRYFGFIRDVDISNLVQTHDMIKGLLNQAILALGSSLGILVLPTVISLSKQLSRLSIGLDKRPDLVAGLTQKSTSAGGDEGPERVTLVESSANVIREAFKKCLSERSGPPSGVGTDGKPEGRRVGIYITANLCLKLFFHCRKLRSAEQIFGNIYQQSPPLSLFPASQRVTFLYYLGRYLFANNHFYRAQLALEEAYEQCHPQCIQQRRSILIYLIASNIILGRFPSSRIWQKPEAAGLQERFQPFCNAIKKGDLATFRHLTDLQNEEAGWFLHRRILLQLSNRCEVLVWRSLARRTFMLSGSQGDATRKTAPTLSLEDVLTLATFLEKKAPFSASKDDLLAQSSQDATPANGLFSSSSNAFSRPKKPSPLSQPPRSADEEETDNAADKDDDLYPNPLNDYVDPDLEGTTDLEDDYFEDEYYNENEEDENAMSTENTITPVTSNGDENPNSNSTSTTETSPLLPSLETVESIIASLINQDLIHGFLSHGQHRLAITGAKNADPVAVGFPKAWDVIKEKADASVPGWVKGDSQGRGGAGADGIFGGKGGGIKFGGGGGGGGGMVVNLSGARPVGVAPG